MGRMLAVVGSLNRAAPYEVPHQGQGITTLAVDTDAGTLRPLAVEGGSDNPTFLAVAADGGTLYATSEVYEWAEGVVTAYRIGGDGGLRHISTQPTGGSVPAQAALDPSGRWLLVANYRHGAASVRPSRSVAAFPVEADGGIGPMAGSVVHDGPAGPVAARQDGPHPHCALFTPEGTRVLVADLGLDRVVVHAFDPDRGALRPLRQAALPPGCGPRHLAWIRPGLLAATGELDDSITTLAWDGDRLRVLDRAATVPGGWAGRNYPADIAASPDGRFVYASNRGQDGLAAFAVDDGGGLTAIGNTATAAWPRSFALDPTGAWVLVACQNGHEVSLHRRDAASGAIAVATARVAVGSAMCVRFVMRGDGR